MAMGSGAMAGEAASAEVPLGHGVDPRGDTQHRPGAGKRARRRARQRAKRRFHNAMELAALEDFGASERSTFLLWCAREMKEMMRQVMDMQAATLA